MTTKDLGLVTAYGYAQAGGYTGTEAEFTEALAHIGEGGGGGAGIIDMEIDENGNLIYTRTDTVNIDFSIVDGELIMEVV